jgi:hypothetical protein
MTDKFDFFHLKAPLLAAGESADSASHSRRMWAQRRTVLKLLSLSTLQGVTQLSTVALLAACQVASLTPLREQDISAQSAGFKLRADQVNPTQSPSYRRGQICANCRFSRANDTENLACDMFPSRSVPSNAWCAHYEAVES